MKLIYVGDPMCSWCYGFAPELEKVIATNSDMDIEFIMGGLRPYYEVPMIEMKDFLTKHWQDVNKATNQPFAYDILDRGDLNYDTEPPSRAVVIVKEMNAGVVPQFFKDTQILFYAQNMDMNQASTYHTTLKKYGLDTAIFDKMFQSNEIKLKTKNGFGRAKSLNVSSFPTLLLQIGDDVHLVSNGYLNSSEIQNRINKITTKNK